MLMTTPNELLGAIIGELQLYSIIEPAHVYSNNFNNLLYNSANQDIKYILKNSLGKCDSDNFKGKIKRFKKKEYNQIEVEKLIDEGFDLSSKHLLSSTLHNILKNELKVLINNYNIFYEECNKIENSEFNTLRTTLLSITSFFNIKNSLFKLNKKYENHKIMVTNKNNILDGMVTNKTIKKFITRKDSLLSRDKNPKKYPLIKTSTIFIYKIECHINSEDEIFSDEHQEIIDYIFLSRLNWLIKNKIFNGTDFYYLLDPKELLINIVNTYTFEEIYKGFRKKGGQWLLDYNHYSNLTYKDSQKLIEKNLSFLILWIKIIKRRFSKNFKPISFIIQIIIDRIPEDIKPILKEIFEKNNSLNTIKEILRNQLKIFYENNSYEKEISNIFSLISSKKGLCFINLFLSFIEKNNNYDEE